ncbi:hypothetical protein D3C80_1214040 [compost metagenome]
MKTVTGIAYIDQPGIDIHRRCLCGIHHLLLRSFFLAYKRVYNKLIVEVGIVSGTVHVDIGTVQPQFTDRDLTLNQFKHIYIDIQLIDPDNGILALIQHQHLSQVYRTGYAKVDLTDRYFGIEFFLQVVHSILTDLLLTPGCVDHDHSRHHK